jgi:hypothetical protein
VPAAPSAAAAFVDSLQPGSSFELETPAYVGIYGDPPAERHKVTVIVNTSAAAMREQKKAMEDGGDEYGHSVAGKRGRHEWVNPAMVYHEEYASYVIQRYGKTTTNEAEAKAKRGVKRSSHVNANDAMYQKYYESALPHTKVGTTEYPFICM